MNGADSPLTCGAPWRALSPPTGCSTLITSAPRSPSSIAQYGPESWFDRSRTRRPSSAPVVITDQCTERCLDTSKARMLSVVDSTSFRRRLSHDHEGSRRGRRRDGRDRKSTRLNSSHSQISYAVFCLKKKK